MKKLPLLFLLLSAFHVMQCSAADKVKLEEGRYGKLQKNALIPGSEHSWILWQLPDGNLELEDHFEEYKPILEWSRGLYSVMDPLLKDAIKKEIVPFDLSAVLAPNGQLLSIKVDGTTALGQKGTGLTCKTDNSSIECKAIDEKAKLKIDNSDGLFWWFRAPVLLRRLSSCSAMDTSDHGNAQKVAFLSLRQAPSKGKDPDTSVPQHSQWGSTAHLESASLNAVNLGKDTVTLGDRSFTAQKCRIEVTPEKHAQVSLTEWTDPKGTILAIQDNAEPDILIGLLQFKRYSNARSVLPTQK